MVKNQTEVKFKNKETIFKLILSGSPISRIELANKTGLTKMTVTNLVSELISDGIVHEIGLVGSGPGRRMVSLEVKSHARLMIGIYISRNHVRAILSDLKGEIIDRYKVRLANENGDSLLKKVYDAIETVMPKSKENIKKVISIGVTCIGPLDVANGRILNPVNFFDIENLDIIEKLKEKYSLPVYFSNDMDAAAIAEKYFGGAGLEANFAYIGIGNGMGAGLVLDGKVYRGAHSVSGEIGHMSINFDGPQCQCGNKGCLELYASLPIEFAEMLPGAQKEVLDRVCPYIAVGIVNLINLFDPTKIYLGHDIIKTDYDVPKKIQELIKGRYMGEGMKSVKIVETSFGQDSVLLGAIAICVENFGELLTVGEEKE